MTQKEKEMALIQTCLDKIFFTEIECLEDLGAPREEMVVKIPKIVLADGNQREILYSINQVAKSFFTKRLRKPITTLRAVGDDYIYTIIGE